MRASRWMIVASAGTVYPTDGRGGATSTAADSSFASSETRGVAIRSVLVTGQHATDTHTITIEGSVVIRIPGISTRTLFGSEAYVPLGGPEGWRLPTGFSATGTSADATCVIWYDVLESGA